MRIPLLIDGHCHTRDFGQRHKGTISTETLSLLSSGFGTVLTMPNTDPPILTHEGLLRAMSVASDQLYCDLGFHFGTDGNNTEEFEKVEGLVKGLKVYLNPTTGDLMVETSQLPKIFSSWQSFKPIMVHVEEIDQLSKIIGLAQGFQRRLHVCHVSLKEQVHLIRQAKRLGVKITAEVCPHHLTFTEGDQTLLGPYGIMKPPLATHKDVEALWQGLVDGTIDIIATDHAPHSMAEKSGENPPFGVISEPTFSVVWTLFSDRQLSSARLVQVMYHNPAGIFGIRKDPNSFMEVDLEQEFTLDSNMIQSEASRSPYEGMRLKGRIRDAFLHGQQVIEKGKVLPAKKGVLI